MAILIAAMFALIAPPLPLIHAELLKRVYRYAFQPGESELVQRLAIQVSIVLGMFAVAAITVWFVLEQADFYAVVAVAALVSVILSAGAIIREARRRKFSNQFTRRIALVTALIALIVPLGVAGFHTAWPYIVTALVGHYIFHREIERYIERNSSVMTNWALDRLTLEILVIFVAMLFPLAFLILTSNFGITDFDLGVVFKMTGIVCTLFASVGSVYLYIRIQRIGIVKKKRVQSENSSDEYNLKPLFSGFEWWRMIFGTAVVWILLSGGLAAVVLVLQVIAGIAWNSMTRF